MYVRVVEFPRMFPSFRRRNTSPAAKVLLPADPAFFVRLANFRFTTLFHFSMVIEETKFYDLFLRNLSDLNDEGFDFDIRSYQVITLTYADAQLCRATLKKAYFTAPIFVLTSFNVLLTSGIFLREERFDDFGERFGATRIL